MSKNTDSSIKLLVLYDILLKSTDEVHALSTNEIIEELQKRGISVSRKVLPSDIDLLNKYGYEICSYVRKARYYYAVHQLFDTAEITMLTDVIKASKLTETRKETIINKLYSTIGIYKNADNTDNIIFLDSKKHGNSSIIYNIDAIETAIKQKKKVSFLYYHLDENKKKVYHKDKKRYVFNPLSLIWSKDNYYLLCYDDRHDGTSRYRIDKMEDVTVESEPILEKEEFSNFDSETYRKQIFSMFGGELEEVTIQFDKELLSDIYDNSALQLYGYDSQRYGLIYNDALKTSGLFDVLETYAQAFFIYALQTSLIVANYSIRTDNRLLSEDNFPLWALDFFSDGQRRSRHSHILDFDVLRLGKKVLENNPKAGSFEFGVVAITEIGKERGNNLELKEVKKKNDETNQKNDLFNSWLKMCRHSATVDNFPFIKVFTDEQRPESWGADARDLCDIVNIVSAGDTKLALPFYTIEDMLSEIAFNRFIALYYDFRYRRGDNTLLVHILKSVTACLWKRNARIYNKYGYSIVKIEKERGTMDGKPENKKYFLMNYKIYRNRFTTDCFSDYFNDLASRTNVGLSDYIEYATEKASVEELKSQNSYFINGLYRDEEGV